MSYVFIIALTFGLPALYFLPTIIAYSRKHKNNQAILLLNFLLGWTVIGWIAALIWSATANTAEK